MQYFCIYFHREHQITMGECWQLEKSEHTCQNPFCLSDSDHVGYHLLCPHWSFLPLCATENIQGVGVITSILFDPAFKDNV